MRWICDGSADCPGASDEQSCTCEDLLLVECGSSIAECLPEPWIINTSLPDPGNNDVTTPDPRTVDISLLDMNNSLSNNSLTNISFPDTIDDITICHRLIFKQDLLKLAGMAQSLSYNISSFFIILYRLS